MLIKVHARWARVQTLQYPEAYARRMVINEHLSWRRRLAGVLRREALTPVADDDRRRPFDQDWVDRAELIGQIRGLPPRQRAVIVLRYFNDLTIAETAAALGTAESTVRAHTARALANLRITLPAEHTPPPASTTAPQPTKDHHAH